MLVRISKYYKKFFLRYSHTHSKSELISFVSLQYVKNLGYPTCLDCVHFVPSKYDDYPGLGKCAKFAKQELSTGNIEMEWADVMRISDKDCGPNAKYKKTIKEDYVKIIHKIPYPDTEK